MAPKDKGTESLFADVAKSVDLKEFLAQGEVESCPGLREHRHATTCPGLRQNRHATSDVAVSFPVEFDHSDTEGDGGASSQPGHLAQSGGNEYLMERCLWIPGLLHILHNAVKELLSSGGMEHAEVYLGLLNDIVNFSGKSQNRCAFIATCLNERPAMDSLLLV